MPVDLPRIAGLDGLRVIAASAVVVYHVMGAVLGSNPTPGVIMPPAAFLFFVISGFVIYRPFTAGHLAGNPVPATRRFYRTRITRVLPLWAVAVSAYLLVQGTDHLHGPGDWAATYLLVQYPFRSLRFAVIGPAWALSVEWIFYLSVPLLAMAVRAGRRRFRPRMSPVRSEWWMLGTLFVAAWILPAARPAVALVTGMALAVFDVDRRRRRRNPVWLRQLSANGWLTIALTAVAWVGLAHYPYKEGLSVQWVEQDPAVLAIWIATALVWFLPVAFGSADREPQRTLGSPRAIALSQLTFGLYLWHQLVLDQVVEHLGRDGSFAASLYLTALGALALTATTFVLIERPCLRLNRLGRPHPAAPTAPPGPEPAPGVDGAEPGTEPAPAPSVASSP